MIETPKSLPWLLGTIVVASFAFSADNDPGVRFRGAPTYDFGVTNVTWEAGTKDYSFVTFDLSWSFSWRVKWVEPAASSATGKDMEVENWDAAWVFVKFLPEKDSEEAKARNHWQHATLDKDTANHVMPAGATNTVKLSDDGSRGMGVFIYRDAIGHGSNDWKRIKLRWLHSLSPGAAGKFDPAKADVKVYAISMVYVPGGPFKVGSGKPSGIFEKFADGPDMPLVQCMNNIRSKDQEMGELTDGSWRGGSAIPFLLDVEWNGPAAEGTRARRFGISAGEIWGTHTYWEVNVPWIGGAGVLNDEYPTGFDAFYCMKYDLTQGQYVDFLNSLPPDVAAERAYVGSDVGSDAGLHSATAQINLGPGRAPYDVSEKGGCTLYSSADLPQSVEASMIDPTLVEEKEKEVAKEMEAFDDMLEETSGAAKTKKDKGKAKGSAVAPSRPVFTARLPFRTLPGPTSSDTIAYAVWAGLRPMSQLEGAKAGNGVRDPLAPPDGTPPKDLEERPVLLDEGLPAERYLKGKHRYGNSMVTRVGCRSTPTSDRWTALATYWGISELGGPAIGLTSRGFRGTHGNGMTSPGKPGASYKRVSAKFMDKPADWTEWGAYLGGHFVDLRCRLVVSADNRIRKPTVELAAPASKAVAKSAAPIPPLDGRQDDLPRIANVKIEPGKDFSTVSFDLAWKNSWRAKWTEPAEKNCTGKPLTLENWDAVWVFLKFRRPDTVVFSHATLSPDAAHHMKPAGAALDIGLSDDPATGLGAGGAKGIGVFIYRDAVGQGANEFKDLKLRWQNGSDQVDSSTAEVSVHAIAMVYVPEGSFRSKSPLIYQKGAHWDADAYICQLTTIDTPDATKPSGRTNSSTHYTREGPDWPNGYGAFYCMKYSISQGEYARFLTEAAPDPKAAKYNGGQYGYLPHNASRRYAPGLYGLSGYTIRYSAGEMRYEADVPERPANFLSDPDILSFTAWAGLRPLTCLEYEKGCRGPRAVARDEDAWAPGICAPATGLAQFVPSLGRQEAPTSGRLAWPGPSYWGIRDLSQSGSVIEWPAVVKEDGRGFTGNHGTGSPQAPGGWVFTSRCEWYALGSWQGFPLSQIGVWILPEDYVRMQRDIGEYISTRSGRYGARAVRTAPVHVDPNAPFQVENLPVLAGCDIGVFHLAGRYRNDSDKPINVELKTPLPHTCFPEGAGSLAFLAGPKSETPFKVLTALTCDVAAQAMMKSSRMKILLQKAGGEVLGEQMVTLMMKRPDKVKPSVISSLANGELAMQIKNATDKAMALALNLTPPPALVMPEQERRVTVAPGAEVRVSFPIPRQGFVSSGVQQIPYRVQLGGGKPQEGQTAVEVRAETRWWLSQSVEKVPAISTDLGEDGLGVDAGDADILENEVPASVPDALFTKKAPPRNWKEEVYVFGGAIPLGTLGSLPGQGDSAVAITRVISPSACQVALRVNHGEVKVGVKESERPVRLLLRVWVNGSAVYDARKAKEGPKPFALLKGANTLIVECRSADSVAFPPPNVSLQFNDPKSGKGVAGLILDMSGGK